MIFPMNAHMLDLLVLSIVEKEDTYGYQMGQIIRQTSNINDNALYSVLKRLKSQNCLTSYDRSFQGRNRRYYRITEEGKKRRCLLRKEWDSYKKSVERILKDE